MRLRPYDLILVGSLFFHRVPIFHEIPSTRPYPDGEEISVV